MIRKVLGILVGALGLAMITWNLVFDIRTPLINLVITLLALAYFLVTGPRWR